MTKVSQLTQSFVGLIHDPPIKAIVTMDNKEILDNVCLFRLSHYYLLHLHYVHFRHHFALTGSQKDFGLTFAFRSYPHCESVPRCIVQLNSTIGRY